MDDPFGCYLVLPGEGNAAHYYLPGAKKALCGEPYRGELVRARVVRYDDRGRPADTTPLCGFCRARNEARWLAMYGRGE